MKKFLVIALTVICAWWFSFAISQLDQSISRMNKNWLTKFTNTTDFMATNNLRRDEASKFFVQYAKEVKGLTPDTSKTTCNFTDVSKARPDLKDIIKEACQLGLFQWSNGKFMPTQSLTNAQAITVLIRMIDWKKDETQWHFAQLYFEKGQKLWIMEWLALNSTANFDKLTTRGDVGILLYNASKLSSSNTSDTSDNTTTNNANIIQNHCLLERPNDASMRDYCEEQQNDWLATLNLGKPSDITSSQFSIIRNKCTSDYPSDFSMRAYCEGQQYDWARTLNLGKPSDIWNTEYNIIRSKCESDYSNDFTMRAYCEGQQYNAVRTLNISTSTKRSSCANQRPNDYTMRVYCEKK